MYIFRENVTVCYKKRSTESYKMKIIFLFLRISQIPLGVLCYLKLKNAPNKVSANGGVRM